MKSKLRVFPLIALAGLWIAPAHAQPVPGEPRQLKVSKPAAKAIAELQAAVKAKDSAAIPARLAAAQAAAQTTDDRLAIARLQLEAAVASNDDSALATALEATLATGALDAAQTASLSFSLGKVYYKGKQFDRAASAFERALAAEPANTDSLILLAETRNAQKRPGDAIALLQRAIQARTSAGQKAEESWHKRAVALAHEAKNPVALELSRQWVAAYPTAANWRDALRLYRNMAQPDEAMTLDALRLARATGALSGDTDFHLYAFTAKDSTPGEARAVIEEAGAAKLIDPAKPLFAEISTALRANNLLSRAALPDLAKEALATSNARLAVRTADAYYGYGDYAQAAELYRAALGKAGADADLINLHLGMALARSGDKAGATAALNAVGGARSELAKYWLVYVNTAA